MDEYSEVSGSKINKTKSEIKYLGTWRNRNESPHGMSVCTGPVNILGVKFHRLKDDGLVNWKAKIDKVNKKLGL